MFSAYFCNTGETNFGENSRIYLKVTDSSGSTVGTSTQIAYDEQGRPYSINYNGSQYYYVLNQQGDVIRIVAGDGTIRAEYRYNAWGEVEETENSAWLGKINPLRYRGYYYDSETGLYYLASRYYDPEVGRWLNADGYITTGQGVLSYSMFAYCLNNPVNRADDTGNSSSALNWWTSTMWWLCGADSVLPFGEVIYAGGMLLLGAMALSSASSKQYQCQTQRQKIRQKRKPRKKIKQMLLRNPNLNPCRYIDMEKLIRVI